MEDAFHAWQVPEDDNFCFEADPMIRKAMKKQAGAAVLQDIQLSTYYANTAGKTYYPGTYHLYLKELGQNLQCLMRTKMSYKQIEEFMAVMGYEVSDVRKCFKECTGLDPAKLEYQRLEDVKATPANIPWYNLGWGYGKGKLKNSAYFIMPYRGAFYTVFLQSDDMNREEVANFITLDQARDYLKSLVQKSHFYDQSAAEQAMDKLEPVGNESTRKEYMVMANYIYDLQQKGTLDKEMAIREIQNALDAGTLTEREANDLVDIYVEAAPPVPGGTESPTAVPQTEGPKSVPDLDYRQENTNVMDEVDKKTPQDFFESVLPDRTEQITSQHVRDVLGYIATREQGMNEFDIKLHSLEYMKHDAPRALVETNPEDGRPAGPPRATVSVVIEVADRTLPKENNRKFALAVFFITPDGTVSTSDSLKGEDDVIYGFSEDGMKQYFQRDRIKNGMQPSI
jgi:hypothetical protein